MKLDQTLKERQEISGVADEITLAKNEGKIQGMLTMLGIMRSTGMKVELTRAKARLQYGVD